MIQRIQTIYLLLVTGLLITTMFLAMGRFVLSDTLIYTFTPLGLAADNVFYSTWGVFAILLLSTIIAFATIFLFNNRMLQIRMSIFCSILLVGYYLTFLSFVFVMKDKLNATAFDVSFGVCLPLVAIILLYLAIRAIGKDEVMVKAADRLR